VISGKLAPKSVNVFVVPVMQMSANILHICMPWLVVLWMSCELRSTKVSKFPCCAALSSDAQRSASFRSALNSDFESEFSADRKLADLCASELSAAQHGNLLAFVWAWYVSPRWVKLSRRLHAWSCPSANSFKFQPCDHTPPGTQRLRFLIGC